jgi:outer membrane protein TolC
LPDNISSDLLARRPDLMAQICRVEAAAKEIGAAKADFYPNVNLSAFAGLESLAFSNLFRDSKTGSLMPAIHLPIFTGGRLRANLRSKVAAFNQAVYAYNDLVLTAAKEVADQIVTVGAIIDGLSQQVDAYEDTAAQYDLLFLRYDKGIDNYLTVLDGENDVLQQRFLLVGQYMDHLSSILNLIKRLGGGYISGPVMVEVP